MFKDRNGTRRKAIYADANGKSVYITFYGWGDNGVAVEPAYK